MVFVATWKDGPRYAPLERPTGFAEPSQQVSLAPEEAEPPVSAGPSDPPSDFQPTGSPVPLDHIDSTPADTRDPRAPFVEVTSAMTSEGGPGAARTPLEPFHVISSAPSAALTWAPPPDFARPAVVRRPVTARDCFTAAYPPLLIALFVVGFVGLVTPLFSVALLVMAPFLILPRVQYRRSQLRIANNVILGILAILWIISLILDSSMYNVDLKLPMWTWLGCWILALTDLILQWIALRNGEPPSSAPPRTF